MSQQVNETNNYYFLKDFKPELYKLAVKMEEDLLITPVSMLAYSTRFLEYILYDIAESNDYEVDTDIGFVKNINELIQRDFIEFNFGYLLIKAYHYRNSSIHNTNIAESLKEDKKTAFELNRKLFDIADIYYKNLTNDYEKHSYIVPKIMEETKEELVSTIIKQEKRFDNCIVCGESTLRTKSNFCTDCDNLLNYREVLAGIITEKGTNALLRKEDFDYGFKNQLIKDLINQNVLEKVGNNFNIVNDELDRYFKLTDEFIKIDEFLADFINGDIEDPFNSKLYLSSTYPYNNVSNVIDGYYIGEVVTVMKNGFSQQYALEQMDVTESFFNNWYENKKSEFLNGYKDKLFIEYNKLLIRDLFRSIEKDNQLIASDDKIDFWSENFRGFSEKLSKKLVKMKLRKFVELFKEGKAKKDALNQAGLGEEEFNEAILIHKVLADEYFEEIEKREALLLDYVKEDSLDEALEKSKLDLKDCKQTQKLTEILQERYLNYRLDSLSTPEICDILTIDSHEVDLWLEDDSFKDGYMEIRLCLFKDAAENYKTRFEILQDLEITEDELDDYIARGRSGDEQFIEYYDYFENVYYDNKFQTFLVEFRIKKNITPALKRAELSQNELDEYLKNHDEYRDEFFDNRMHFIADYHIRKGKVNEKFLKKMGMSKKDYRDAEEIIDEIVMEKQVILITETISNHGVIYSASKEVHCNWEDVFEWIYSGTCGDERYEELADEYWSDVLQNIKKCNSILKRGDSISLFKHMVTRKSLAEYDLQYWRKWGLIDKHNIIANTEDIKNIIKKDNH